MTNKSCSYESHGWPGGVLVCIKQNGRYVGEINFITRRKTVEILPFIRDAIAKSENPMQFLTLGIFIGQQIKATLDIRINFSDFPNLLEDVGIV